MKRSSFTATLLAGLATIPVLGGAERSAIYSPVGKRDPFKSPAVSPSNRGTANVSPIEKFNVEQLQLRAVMRGLGKARAMFEDPEGKTFIVKEGDILGRERAVVSRILNSEVIVTERSFNYLGEETLYEKILSLPPDPEVGDVRGNTPGPAGNAKMEAPREAGGAPMGGAPAPAAPAPAEGGTIRGGGGDGLVY